MTQASATYRLDRDLKEAAAMADGLEEYVRENALYGRTHGGWFGGNMPALTVGALLLRLRRLRVLAETMNEGQRGQLAEIETRHDAVRAQWTHHYETRMRQELFSRLKAMDAYFEEMRDDPRSGVNSYLPEAQRRTIAQEIADAIPPHHLNETETAEMKAALRKADGGLRRWIESAPFIWPAALEPVYPQPKFWWLYARPAVPKREDG